jgi:hypothetical protein
MASRSPQGSWPSGWRRIVFPSAETVTVQSNSGSVSEQKPPLFSLGYGGASIVGRSSSLVFER